MKKMSTYVAIVALISTISCILVYGSTGVTVKEGSAKGTWYRYTDSKKVYSQLSCDSRTHSTATGYNDKFLWMGGDDIILSRSGLTKKGEIAKASSDLHVMYVDKSWWDIYDN